MALRQIRRKALEARGHLPDCGQQPLESHHVGDPGALFPVGQDQQRGHDDLLRVLECVGPLATQNARKRMRRLPPAPRIVGAPFALGKIGERKSRPLRDHRFLEASLRARVEFVGIQALLGGEHALDRP